MNVLNVKEKLYAPLATHSRRGRGGNYDYVKAQDVYDRMNDVFGADWSSEVIRAKEVGNNIIVHARVTIMNDNRCSAYQDGFGGAINDAGSEAGNAYKSAFSKAIKDACKKWGIGLFLDEDGSYTATTSAPTNSTPTPPAISTQTPPTTPTPTPPATPPPTTPVSPPEALVAPANVAVTNRPPRGLDLPPGVSRTLPNGVSSNAGPATPPPSTPPQVNLNEDMPMSTTTVNAGEANTISDVQKAALHSILSIDGVEYETLVKEAFEINGLDGTVIPAIDDLKYKEAVYVVKYGNDKFRRH